MRRVILVLASLAAAIMLLVVGNAPPEKVAAAPKPNILFVMTDDQPKATMKAMPKVRSRVAGAGMTLPNAYVSESQCCPSRASILRGQYPHNTGVLSNGGPYGGVQAFRASGAEDNTVGGWLRRQGYHTALVGRYMNGYDASYKPPGWDYWYSTGKGGGSARVNGNGRMLANPSGKASARYRAQAMDYLERRTDQASDGPFALFFWTGQPHLPAASYGDRYAGMYSRATLDAKPSFNERDVSDKPRWVRGLDRIGGRERDRILKWRRNQLRSVKQVDDAVGNMLDLLKRRGELDNTYVVFTTDNGIHMGEHRWFARHGAKNTAYEEAANVPMYVRGPGIRAGSSSEKLVLNNDLAPTFVQIAGGEPPAFVDGRSLLPLWKGRASAWRTAIMNERPVRSRDPMPPYHAVVTQRYTYVEYATGERELYDRAVDPYQQASKHNSAAYAGTRATLSGRLRALDGCRADACRRAENGG